MELILIRHARPELIENADGPADPPLTELGRRQAEAVAGWLAGEPLDALYTSPMLRARQTAEPIARLTGMEPGVVDDVSEIDAHSSNYIPLEVIRQDRSAWQEFLAAQDAMERDPFVAKVVDALEALIAAHSGERIAVVCHGGVINAWAADVLGLPPRLFLDAHYTSISRFMAASSGERSVVTLNETAHLGRGPSSLLKSRRPLADSDREVVRRPVV